MNCRVPCDADMNQTVTDKPQGVVIAQKFNKTYEPFITKLYIFGKKGNQPKPITVLRDIGESQSLTRRSDLSSEYENYGRRVSNG